MLPILSCGFKQSPRPFHIGPVHFVGIPHPEPVVGRHMKHGIAAGHGPFERGDITQIAGCRLSLESLKVSQVAGRANEETQVGALIGQNARDMGAEKSGGAGDKGFQSLSQLSVRLHDFPGLPTRILLAGVVGCSEKMQ
jgi:hypothetical protein